MQLKQTRHHINASQFISLRGSRWNVRRFSPPAMFVNSFYAMTVVSLYSRELGLACLGGSVINSCQTQSKEFHHPSITCVLSTVISHLVYPNVSADPRPSLPSLTQPTLLFPWGRDVISGSGAPLLLNPGSLGYRLGYRPSVIVGDGWEWWGGVQRSSLVCVCHWPRGCDSSRTMSNYIDIAVINSSPTYRSGVCMAWTGSGKPTPHSSKHS